MKLVAFGDSFTEGLIKEPIENTQEERAEINYANQLLKLDNPFTSLENLAYRGNGNETIAYKIYKRLQSDYKDCFFLVAWSAPARQGMYIKKDDEYKTDHHPTIKHYKFQTEMLMLGIHFALNEFKVPHAFINAFSPHTHYSNLFNSKFFNKINYINSTYKRNTLFDIIAERYGNTSEPDQKEFFDVASNKYISKCNHPTALGHQLIAEKINPFLKKTLDTQLKEYII